MSVSSISRRETDQVTAAVLARAPSPVTQGPSPVAVAPSRKAETQAKAAPFKRQLSPVVVRVSDDVCFVVTPRIYRHRGEVLWQPLSAVPNGERRVGNLATLEALARPGVLDQLRAAIEECSRAACFDTHPIGVAA